MTRSGWPAVHPLAFLLWKCQCTAPHEPSLECSWPAETTLGPCDFDPGKAVVRVHIMSLKMTDLSQVVFLLRGSHALNPPLVAAQWI